MLIQQPGIESLQFAQQDFIVVTDIFGIAWNKEEKNRVTFNMAQET